MSQVIYFCLLFIFISKIPAEGNDNVHLSAYYYPWYDSDGRHWNEGYLGKASNQGPLLGEYSSRDAKVIYQHANWSLQSGVKNWICAWWGKGSWEDVTIKYRIAPVLDQIPGTERPVTFCIFYESEGLLGLDSKKGIEFGPANTRKFLDDMGYIADTYFDHPSYYKIEGRPVVYLYLSRTFSGDYASAITRARSLAKEKGINLYLVGDEVYWGEPDFLRISQFDAITSYNMHGPKPEFENPGDWTKFIRDVGQVYNRYKKEAEKLGVSFIPGILPGFNSHGADPTHGHYIIPRYYKNSEGIERSTLVEFTKLANETLDGKYRSAAVTSFNEWHEGTQIEPIHGEKGVSNTTLLDFSSAGYRQP